MKRIVMHIDVNNAFLSWTAIDLLNHGSKYDIRNSYAVIGGDEEARRGIVLAKSMPAKKMGVVTAETLYSARKKCPSLRVYPPNYKWYQFMSNSLFELLKEYTPDIEIVSIDECYLEYTNVMKLYGDPIEFAKKIQKEINEKLKFTVNIGIAENKLCAKMASDFLKPNKIHTLFSDEIKEKMWPLPINKLFGIGKQTSKKLIALNIKTIADLANADPDFLYKHFKNQALRMIEIANGIDNGLVDSSVSAPKGISNSTTLSHDVTNREELEKIIIAIADNVSLALRKEGKYASVVAVMLKDNFFKTTSHQKKLKNATDLTLEIRKIALELFREMYHGEAIRLVGVRLDQLTDVLNHQVSLFENVEEREENKKLDETIDILKERFGNNIIKNGIQKENIKRKY